MRPNLEHIQELVYCKQWNGSELARKMGVSRSEANRLLNGKRTGGKKVIAGLMQAFPEESLDSLFFLPCVYPNDTENRKIETTKKPRVRPVKHPDAHQLDCCLYEERGLIEIKRGKKITRLTVPPGPIEVEYITEQ